MEQWKAKWIMYEGCGENVTPVFRREFRVSDSFHQACLRICGLGFYLLYINGKRVGDELLQPAFTAYDKRVLYNTYDVADYLHPGKNEVEVTLGNGWFHEPGQDCFDFEHAVWKNFPQMILELYVDEALLLISDSAWQCREGRWQWNSVRFGEDYSAGIQEGSWQQASVAKGPGGLLQPQRMPGIKMQEYREPVTRKGNVFDFGKNLAGDAEITFTGAAGETAEIIYGERLDEAGDVDQTLIKRHPTIPRNQRDYYTKGSNREETWHSEFSYKGFRYVQIKGKPEVKDIRARVFFTDLKKNGEFLCTNPLLQELYDACLWSVRTNFHHIPTDCPHREKNGWTGDAHISSEFALLNLDMREAYRQYADNLADCQWPSGQLPCIAPTSVYGYNWQCGPTWDAALILIPWNVYRFTKETEILEKNYEAMKAYMRYTSQISEEGICDSGLGDFLPDVAVEVCPKAMLLSCFVMRLGEVMTGVAQVLDKPEREEWQEQAAFIKEAVRQKFYGKCKKTESYLSCVLYFGLSEQPKEEARELAELVRQKKYRAGGGIFGSVYTLEMLTKYGYFEDALEIVLQEDFPGWAYMLKNGGGTLWEHWSGRTGSLNHHMRCGVGAWMFRALTGLCTEECAPGWKHLVFRPNISEKAGDVKAWHQTPYGKIRISLQGGFLRLELPEEVTADVYWKGKKHEIRQSSLSLSLSL